MIDKRIIQFTVLTASLGCYVLLGYFTERTEFVQIICLYSILFTLYIYVIFGKAFKDKYKLLVISAIVFRISLFLMTPNLTDDFYRYIWDGLVFTNGHNPYLVTPSELMSSSIMIPGIDSNFFESLNSPYYYSAYPPISQYIFGIITKIAGNDIFINILLLHGFFIVAETGSLLILSKLSRCFGRDPEIIFFYALNPLVIMELSGNLHLEGLMIFFLLFTLYMLVKQRILFSSILFGLAIGIKLIPLILLPLILKYIKFKRGVLFIIGTVITLLIAVIPFLNSEAVINYYHSLELYFRAFEFNASIYYLLRLLNGLNDSGSIISIIQLILPLIAFAGILIITWKTNINRSESFWSGMLGCLTIYYLLSTNIHPWHLTLLVVLSVFSDFRYLLTWSAGIVLSYFAYRTIPFSENIWLILVEYLAFGSHLGYEIGQRFRYRKT